MLKKLLFFAEMNHIANRLFILGQCHLFGAVVCCYKIMERKGSLLIFLMVIYLYGRIVKCYLYLLYPFN